MEKKYDDQDTSHILNLIGKYTDLRLILNTVSQWLESRISNALVTLMLYSEQEQTLTLVSGQQHFSDQYCMAIDGLKISLNQGTCGAAAVLRQLVISNNVMEDPHWASCRALVDAEQIASCWSIPIISATGVLYGTFATYYRTLKIPTEPDIQLLQRAAALVALAIELDNERQKRLEMIEKYSSFYTYHPDVIFELDMQGYILNTNIACREITGFSEDQIQGQHYCTFIPAEYHELANAAFKQALQGQAQYYELPIYHASGETLWLDLTNLPVKQNQKVTGVFGIARDITSRRKNQENLRLLKRGVDASPNGIFITDASEEMLIVYVNPAFLNLTGYTEQEVMGRNCNFLQDFDSDLEQILILQQAVIERKEVQVTLKNYCKDGSWFWSRLTLGPVLDKEGKCTHFLGIQEDITEQRIHQEYIKHQHSHDYLTGLPNQKAFEFFLKQSFEAQHDSLPCNSPQLKRTLLN